MRRLLAIAGLAVFVAVTCAPSVAVLRHAFVEDGHLTLAHLGRMAVDSRYLDLQLNTLLVGLGTIAVALLLGLPLSFLLNRTDLPGFRWLSLLVILPIVVPPYLGGIAWTHLLPWLSGYFGVVLMLGFGYFPIVVLLVGRAFVTTEPAMEEAALLARGRLPTLLCVTLRLATPAILASAVFVFVIAVSDFGTPDYFTTTVTKPFNVYATEVFSQFSSHGDLTLAGAASLLLVLVSSLGVFSLSLLEGRGTYSTLGGAYREPARWSLGRARWPAGLGTWLLYGAIAVGPLLILLEWSLGARVTTEGGIKAAFPAALSEIGDDLRSSFVNAVAAALVVVVLAFLPAYTAARLGKRWQPLGTVALLLPFAVPAVALAIGYIELFNVPDDPVRDFIYTGRGLVILGLAARFLPLGALGLRASIARIDPAVEEAAVLSGRSFPRILTRIIAPLAGRGALATGLIVYAFAMRELDTIHLFRGGNDTIVMRIFNQIHFAYDAQVAAMCLLLVTATVLPLLVVRLLVKGPLRFL
ncbi:MAG: hypothetical protein AB1486_28315 [Planctomycetota bacterium]